MNTFFLAIGLVFVLSFAFVYGSLFLIARAEVLLSQLKAQGAETALACAGTLVEQEATKSDIARAEVLLSQLKAQGTETAQACAGILVEEEAIKSDADEVFLWHPGSITVIHSEGSANKVVLVKQRTPTVSRIGSYLAAASRANSYDFSQLRTA